MFMPESILGFIQNTMVIQIIIYSVATFPFKYSGQTCKDLDSPVIGHGSPSFEACGMMLCLKQRLIIWTTGTDIHAVTCLVILDFAWSAPAEESLRLESIFLTSSLVVGLKQREKSALVMVEVFPNSQYWLDSGLWKPRIHERHRQFGPCLWVCPDPIKFSSIWTRLQHLINIMPLLSRVQLMC